MECRRLIKQVSRTNSNEAPQKQGLICWKLKAVLQRNHCVFFYTSPTFAALTASHSFFRHYTPLQREEARDLEGDMLTLKSITSDELAVFQITILLSNHKREESKLMLIWQTRIPVCTSGNRWASVLPVNGRLVVGVPWLARGLISYWPVGNWKTKMKKSPVEPPRNSE